MLFSEFDQGSNLNVNSDNFMNHPVLPDLMVSKRDMKDIPKKFIKPISHPLPYQGLSIDTDSGKEFKQALNFIKTIKES